MPGFKRNDCDTVFGNMSRCQEPPKDTVWVFYTLVLPVVIVNGLLGNSLVIAVTLRTFLSNTGLLVASLAIADSCTLLFFFQYRGTEVIRSYYIKTPWLNHFYLEFIMKRIWLLEPLYQCSKSASTWTVVYISCQRFVAVLKPMKASTLNSLRRTCTHLVTIMVILVSFWSTRMPAWRTVTYPDFCDDCTGSSFNDIGLTMHSERSFLDHLHDENSTLLFMIQYSVPMSILFVLNYMIISTLAKARKERKILRGEQKRSSDETRMLVIVVAVFMVLETPRALICVGIFYFDSKVGISIDGLTAINCSTNFVLYAVFGRRFRDEVRKMFSSTICFRRQFTVRWKLSRNMIVC